MKTDKLSCPIVRDLIPLYHDGAVSEETKNAIAAHIAECPDCSAELEKLNREIPLESAQTDTGKSFRKFAKRQRKKHRILNILCFVIGAALVLSGALYFVMTANIIPYPPDAIPNPDIRIYHYRAEGSDVHSDEYDDALFIYMREPFGGYSSEITRIDGQVNLVYKHAIWNPRQFSMGLHYTEEMIPINADDKTFCINGKKICDIGEPDTDLPPYVKYYHDMIYNGGSWESGHFDENLDEREARETPDDFFMYSPYLDEKKGYIKWDLEGNELENTLK